MIHGDRQRFAIEWALDLHHAGHFLLGKLCFWVGGVQIGEYERGATLSDVLVCLTYLVGDCGNRTSQRFCNTSCGDAFSLIHRGVFDADESLADIVEQESWARFDISIPIDIFSGWRLYLIDCIGFTRLLVGKFSEEAQRFEAVQEFWLAIGEFDSAIRAFQIALEAQLNANL